MNPLDAIKNAASGDGDVAGAINKAIGTYTEKLKPGADANYPQNDMTKGADPSPFSVGPVKK